MAVFFSQLKLGYRFAVGNPHLVAAVQSAVERQRLAEAEEARRVAAALQKYERTRRELDDQLADIRDNYDRMVRPALAFL